MSSIPDYTGFAYLVRNTHGTEFILSATFAVSRTKAKSFLKKVQNERCEQRRPMFEVVELLEVQVSVLLRAAA